MGRGDEQAEAMGIESKIGVDVGAWRLEMRGVVEEHLAAQGIEHSGVLLLPELALPPQVSLWRCKPDFWAIAGDLPTDHLLLDHRASPRVALQAFSERWRKLGADRADWAELLLELAEQGAAERRASREAHYARMFGRCSPPAWYSTDGKSPHVDVYQFPPGGARRCWTLVTGGMSDLRQPALLLDCDDIAPRAELLMYVREPKPWMVSALKAMAAMPFDASTFLYWGHTVPNGQPMTVEPSELTSFFLDHPHFEDPELLDLTIDGDEVSFLWLRPITESERAYAIQCGSQRLSELFAALDADPVVDERRGSFVQLQ
jgi:hypothetical protein